MIAHQGGTRSGKTYSIVQFLTAYAALNPGPGIISIVSSSYPHLRRGALRDWQEIMETFGIYQESLHNKTESSYRYHSGWMIEFFSADQAAKVRGPGRDILFMNEANLFSLETFRQLSIRTRKTVILDYNPADEFHWIYDEVLPRSDCYFFKSTYKDNPFLPPEQIREIESYKNSDANFWRVYGEGERGTSRGIIYNHWQTYSGNISGEYVYGVDFGFNHPSAVVKVTEVDGAKYCEQKIYNSHLTEGELIQRIKQFTVPGDKFVCDSARPDIIESFKRAGLNAILANKDVKAGITNIQSRPLFIHAQSSDLIKELKSYKWKEDSSGNPIDEPTKIYDDAVDAMRYGAMWFNKPKQVFRVGFHR